MGKTLKMSGLLINAKTGRTYRKTITEMKNNDRRKILTSGCRLAVPVAVQR
jgi:hypothetical protein